MQLSFEQLCSAALGVSYCTQELDGVHLHRFSPTQEEYYRETNAAFYKKANASAGIQLRFKTNSPTLRLRLSHKSGSSRNYAFSDILVNGKMLAHLGSATQGSGEFIENYALDAGEKEIRIVFPWSSSTIIHEICLEENSSFTPLPRSRKMLLFGDSITQGYDAFYPTRSYASILAEYLRADAINKGIGAEQFVPELLVERENISPDVITVAYGTNDWNANRTVEEFSNRARLFISRLTALYPNAKVYVISPLWRGDEKKRMDFPFIKIEEILRNIASSYHNVHVLCGYSFVEHDPTYYSPDVLHPNDEGFAQYAENLCKQIHI